MIAINQSSAGGHLPYPLDRILIKNFVAADDRYLLNNRLRDHHAIERITMVKWQTALNVGTLNGNGQCY